MDYSELGWEQPSPLRAGSMLSSDDIEEMVRLLSELRELTQSRGSWAAASEILKRFGYEADSATLVRPAPIAN